MKVGEFILPVSWLFDMDLDSKLKINLCLDTLLRSERAIVHLMKGTCLYRRL